MKRGEANGRGQGGDLRSHYLVLGLRIVQQIIGKGEGIYAHTTLFKG